MTELVGVVPAAGHATRLGALPISKELVPLSAARGVPPRLAIAWLLEGFRRAGVARALVVLRSGKWDIPAALGTGSAFGLELAYRVVEPTPGVVHTIAAGAAWLSGARVAFGFPDIVFRPEDAVARLARRQVESGADVVLGLVPTDRPDKADLVETDAQGRLRGIRVKPGPGARGVTWMHAVWSPAFTAFLIDQVAASGGGSRPRGRELYPSDVFVAAASAGLMVECLAIRGGRYLDIGTPEDLARAPKFLRNRH